MRIQRANGPTPPEIVAEHVAFTGSRPRDRAFVRLNMVASADGGTAISGVSSGLGNRDDHAVFSALRGTGDAVLVGISTVVAEHYHAPSESDPPILVIARRPDISGDPDLFSTMGATLVLPEDADAAPEGIPTLRAGTGGQVDLAKVTRLLAGQIVIMEGGPVLAGSMVALGLVDELFLTIAPRVIAGQSARVTHGLNADPMLWDFEHGFVDEEGFLFLRYGKPVAPR
jgi:riboflavin biosynthesis pyrimidine reductase